MENKCKQKTISKSKISMILRSHELWTETTKQGIQAVFNNLDLQDHNLSHMSLLCIQIKNCNLSNVNLLGSTLQSATLENNIMPDISWVIPGKLVKLYYIKHPGFLTNHKNYWQNFYDQYTPIDELNQYGTILEINEDTFNMLANDKIIYDIPNWVLYTAILKP